MNSNFLSILSFYFHIGISSFRYKADRLGKIKKDERVYDAESKTNTTEQVLVSIFQMYLFLKRGQLVDKIIILKPIKRLGDDYQ